MANTPLVIARRLKTDVAIQLKISIPHLGTTTIHKANGIITPGLPRRKLLAMTSREASFPQRRGPSNKKDAVRTKLPKTNYIKSGFPPARE